MKDLKAYTGEDKVVSSLELYEKLNQEHHEFFIKTKFPSLNALIGGFHAGELNVISGITGNGKTLLGQTLTEDFASQNIYSLWFTYEVPMLQFLKQFGEPIPHFYMPEKLKDKSLDWIQDRILEAKQKFNIKVIFIDHLHYLSDIMMKRNPSLEIGQVMRTLKRWAIDLELMIFLIAHTGKVKPDKELDTGDCRDSSFVEQEPDNVFYIWRILNKENEAILKITKNRGCGVMNKKIKLFKKDKYLVEKSSISLPSVSVVEPSDNNTESGLFDNFGMEN